MKRDLLGSKHTLFRLFYRLGFTPWDGHPLAQSLRNLVEGNELPALPAGDALELGCGTGDTSIYLAKKGWRVTAVDFVPTPLEKARVKAGAENVNFVQADVRQLRQNGISGPFRLIVDNGCLHNMNDNDRDAYGRRFPSRRTIRRTRHRRRGDATAFRLRLDAALVGLRAGARSRENPDALLPFPARRLGIPSMSWLLDSYCFGSSMDSGLRRGMVIRSLRRCANS
jgi:SAM-dependent methyltransferase